MSDVDPEVWHQLADDFADEVRTFREAVEDVLLTPQDEAVEVAVPLLLMQISAVQATGAMFGALTDVERPEPDAEFEAWTDRTAEMTPEQVAEMADRLAERLGPVNSYARVFDPYDDEAELVVGTLSEDVADIVRDLDDGLLAYDAGYKLNAAWTWQFTYRNHWGRHAASAVLALQALIND